MKHGRRFWFGALLAVLAAVLVLFAAGGQDVLAEGDIIKVEIDVTPDIANNVIRVRPWVKVEVAILTTLEFDTAHVDAETVVIAGAPAMFPVFQDVDFDGDQDLVLLFAADEMDELDRDSTKATLTGETIYGVQIEGTDKVKVR